MNMDSDSRITYFTGCINLGYFGKIECIYATLGYTGYILSIF